MRGQKQTLVFCCHNQGTSKAMRSWKGKESSLLGPMEGGWPCQHLDFRLLASRTVSEYISVVISHPICGNLFWQSQERNAQIKRDSASERPAKTPCTGAMASWLPTWPVAQAREATHWTTWGQSWERIHNQCAWFCPFGQI